MKKTKRILAVILVAVMALALTGCNSLDYRKAVKSFESGDYAAAGEIFRTLADYKDSAAQAQECDYLDASGKLDEGAYDEAKAILETLTGYKDSAELVKECDYQAASELLASGDFEGAYKRLEGIAEYKDSAALLIDAKTGFIKNNIVGNWISEELDASEFMMRICEYAIGEDAEQLFTYCPLTDFILVLDAEFTESGKLYQNVTEESFAAAMDNLKKCIRDGFDDYLMAVVEEALAEEGATMADLEAMIGEPVTTEYLAENVFGMTTDEMLDSSFDFSDYIDATAFASTSTWEIKDGRIIFTTGEENEYAEYDMEKNEITFTGEGLDDQEQVEMLYPLTYHRA